MSDKVEPMTEEEERYFRALCSGARSASDRGDMTAGFGLKILATLDRERDRAEEAEKDADRLAEAMGLHGQMRVAAAALHEHEAAVKARGGAK